eukprot:Rmarinus@m.10735
MLAPQRTQYLGDEEWRSFGTKEFRLKLCAFFQMLIAVGFMIVGAWTRVSSSEKSSIVSFAGLFDAVAVTAVSLLGYLGVKSKKLSLLRLYYMCCLIWLVLSVIFAIAVSAAKDYIVDYLTHDTETLSAIFGDPNTLYYVISYISLLVPLFLFSSSYLSAWLIDSVVRERTQRARRPTVMPANFRTTRR